MTRKSSKPQTHGPVFKRSKAASKKRRAQTPTKPDLSNITLIEKPGWRDRPDQRQEPTAEILSPRLSRHVTRVLDALKPDPPYDEHGFPSPGWLSDADAYKVLDAVAAIIGSGASPLLVTVN